MPTDHRPHLRLRIGSLLAREHEPVSQEVVEVLATVGDGYLELTGTPLLVRMGVVSWDTAYDGVAAEMAEEYLAGRRPAPGTRPTDFGDFRKAVLDALEPAEPGAPPVVADVLATLALGGWHEAEARGGRAEYARHLVGLYLRGLG